MTGPDTLTTTRVSDPYTEDGITNTSCLVVRFLLLRIRKLDYLKRGDPKLETSLGTGERTETQEENLTLRVEYGQSVPLIY